RGVLFRSKCPLGMSVDMPAAGWTLLRQAKPLQMLQATDQQLAAGMTGKRLQPYFIRRGLAQQLAIEAGPAILTDFALQPLPDLPFGTRSQPFGGQLAGPVAHALRDIVACDDQVPPGFVLATQDDMGMRVVGVPVV